MENITYKMIINLFSALLTPVIAVGMFYVAYQQWKTSEKEIRNELFAKRYNSFYSPIREIMSLIILIYFGIEVFNDTKENIIHSQITKIKE